MCTMAGLSDKEYREILNLIYLANQCEDVDGFIKTIFPFILKVFKVECATFHLIDTFSKHLNIVEARSFKADSSAIYEDRYYPDLYKKSFYRYSPLLKKALSSSRVVLKIGEAVSCREWERSVLYNDFIRPQFLYWELFLPLRLQNNLEGMVTLWRSKKQMEYEDRDIIKAEIFAPHLTVALHNARAISQINIWKQHFLSTDDSSSKGQLQLDYKLEPTFFNARARDICMQLLSKIPYTELNLGKGAFPIPSCIIEDCNKLRVLLKIKDQHVFLPIKRIVDTESGHRFRVECSLIRKNNHIRSMPDFMVILSDLTEEKNIQIVLKDIFHLSKREIDIICLLPQGMSDDEIAEKLYISKRTVQTHKKNIYKKLGIKSKFELYQVIIKNIGNPGVQQHERLSTI